MSEPRKPIYKDQDVRQGEIILRTRTRRIIFLTGLVGAIVLAFVLMIFAHAGHPVAG